MLHYAQMLTCDGAETCPKYFVRVAQFGYESWELDSLDPEVLVELIRDRISHYTDQRLLARQQDREDEERRDLDALMDRWDEVRDFLNGEAS